MLLIKLILILVSCIFGIIQCQGYQPIVHYVLQPVEIFRIPRPDYQPQIHVVPTEDLGNHVVNHPSNEYFRNLLINTVNYDVMEVPRYPKIRTVIQSTPSDNLVPPPLEMNPVPSPETPIFNDDIEIIENATISNDINQNKTARIIVDSNETNITSSDDEEDSGSIELTTPSIEDKKVNKTSERHVTRRAVTSSPYVRNASVPIKLGRHVRHHYPKQTRHVYHHNTPQSHYTDDDHDESFDDDDSFVINSSDSDSYHDVSDQDLDIDVDEHDLDDTDLDNNLNDIFQYDHKNTDHKVLNYKRADKTINEH